MIHRSGMVKPGRFLRHITSLSSSFRLLVDFTPRYRPLLRDDASIINDSKSAGWSALG